MAATCSSAIPAAMPLSLRRPATSGTVSISNTRTGDTSNLFASPGSGSVLVVPAGRRLVDPALGERCPDIVFPLRFAVRARDFLVERGVVLVLGRDQRVDLLALRERDCVGVAQGDVAVAGDADGAACIQRR